MWKRLLIGLVAVVVVLIVAMYVTAQVKFGSERTRAELEARLSEIAGEPVHVGAVHGRALGPVTVTLSDIAVGAGAGVHIDAVRLRSSPLALLTGRLAPAAVIVEGTRIALPVAGLGALSQRSAGAVLGSVSSLTLVNFQVSTRGRRLRVDAEVRPRGEKGVAVTSATIAGDDMHAEASGEITDVATWAGTFTVHGDALDGDVLRSAGWDLLEQPQPESSTEQPTAAIGNTPLHVTMDVRRLTLGPVVATSVKGTAGIGPGAIAFDPIAFDALGGSYKGQMTLRYEGGEPAVRWYGDLSTINLTGLTTPSSGPAAITGTLSGDVDLTGTGIDFAKAMSTVRGSARVTLNNGRISNLGLVRSILAASSPNPQEAAAGSNGPGDTTFRSLSTVLTMSGGSASLINTQLDGDDLHLIGGGAVKLDGSAVTLFADVQLSEALSQQVAKARGRTLDAGQRLMVPVTIRGGTAHYQVSVDVGEMSTAPLTGR